MGELRSYPQVSKRKPNLYYPQARITGDYALSMRNIEFLFSQNRKGQRKNAKLEGAQINKAVAVTHKIPTKL